MEVMENMAWALLGIPLVAMVVNALLLRRAGMLAALVSVVSVLLTLGVTVILLLSEPKEPASISWIEVGQFQLSLGLRLDPLSIGMMFVVTAIGTMVHLFSLGYMAEDSARGRYFAGLSLFMFSMTGIVLADSLLMMFIFWELVGVSSYVLIGHYYRKPAAGDACLKAFLTNRIGDFGFMIGILMVWGLTGSVYFADIKDDLPGLAEGAAGWLTLATLLVFCGAVGKSAQMPLHVWLPDAMEGPTPVSALIHAATMVAAGVYMLVRMQVLIDYSDAGIVIAWVGIVTAIFAAVVALQQDDIKRILAYSTLSQLGYMVMAVGLHGYDEAMFHLYTHGFFKALLFLASGAVIMACHHQQNIWQMGGLNRRMLFTFGTFLIGAAALAAVKFTSGYYSKESILMVAYDENRLIFWIGLAVAFLTPLYMTRLIIVAFFGQARSDDAAKAREVSPVMLVPLLILAVFSVVAGNSGVAEKLSAMMPHHEQHEGAGFVETASMGALLAGVVLGMLIYRGRSTELIRLPVLEKGLYLDAIYAAVVKIFQDFVGYVVYALDQLLLGGLVVTGGSKAIEGLGKSLRRVQSGNLQAYGWVFALGVLAVLWMLMFR